MNVTSHEFENFLKQNDGKDIVPEKSAEENKYRVLPGEITDLSMIADGARKECLRGYKWVVADNGDGKLYNILYCIIT